MVAAQYAPTVPLPLPTAGLNKKLPLSDMPAEYCSWALNWEPEPQYCRVRNGYVVHCDTGAANEVVCIFGYGTTALFSYSVKSGGNIVQNVTTATPSTVYTAADDTDDDVFALYFGGRVAIVVPDFPADTSAEYSGSVWSTFNFGQKGRAGLSYKGRIYLGGDSDTLLYGGLAAITGAMTTVNTSSLWTKTPVINFLGILTSPSNRAEEQFLVIGGRDGEILIYAGDNPGATNWEQIARITLNDMTIGVNQNTVLQHKNDVYVLTQNGLLSVRRTLEVLESEEDMYLSKAIRPYWTSLMKNMVADANYSREKYAPSIAYWPEKNSLYILVPGFLDNDGTFTEVQAAATMLVYNLVSQAWQVQKIVMDTNQNLVARGVTYFNNNIYFSIGRYIIKMGTGYKDEIFHAPGTYQAYDIKLEGAYINFSEGKKFKKVEGWDLVCKTDFTGTQLGMKSAADFGRKVSSTSNQPFPVDGYNNPFYSVGVDGNYIQYRIDGTSDTASTDGFELYSVGASVR